MKICTNTVIWQSNLLVCVGANHEQSITGHCKYTNCVCH